jgi:hypothetical protein
VADERCPHRWRPSPSWGLRSVCPIEEACRSSAKGRHAERTTLLAARCRCSSPSNKFAGEESWLGSLTSAMHGQPAPSPDTDQGRPGRPRGRAAGSGGDALRVVRVTRDQLGIAWSSQADPSSWQVVCWDSRDAGVARLKLTGRHRRATFAGLARLQQPFTIAVSGLGRDGSVLWQGGLADLYLRADRPAGREGASGRMRARRHGGTASQGGREQLSPKRPKKDPEPGKTGKTRKPKPKRQTARGK